MGPQRLVDIVERQLDAGVVGVAIAVVAGDEVKWSGGFGRLDVEQPDPVTAQTRFPIQSVTKSIVATALMQWIERGAIGLDDPVNQHVHPVVVANAWEARSPITIRQLLTHTAGLPVSLGWGTGASLEEMVAHDVVTDAEPGTRMIYANWGYDVLGYLLERLTGTTWDLAVAQSVLQPLGMQSTSCPAPATGAVDDAQPCGHVVSRLDGSHLRMGSSQWPYHPGPPSGSLVSNADDLSRFLLAHFNGGAPILASATIDDMHRLHAPLGDGGGGMGLGFRVDPRAGRRFFCHGGDGVGFTILIAAHPDERVGVALLMNTGGVQEARSVIARAALEWALADADVRAASDGTATRPSLGGYRSTYWGLRADITEAAGVPVVTVGASAISSATSVSRLTSAGARWRADGGMFDGCELDFDAPAGGRRFVGGVYAFEFVADDTRVVDVPTAVDETGDLSGAWSGMTDTPLGPIPLELTVNAAEVVVDVMGANATYANAEPNAGWLRAHFALDVIGFGAVKLFTRLGLVEGRLEGLLYARYEGGELCLPTVLERSARP